MLRTFALALREAEKWDQSPLIGANVFLAAPGENGLSEAARELGHRGRNRGIRGPQAIVGRHSGWANWAGHGKFRSTPWG